MFSMVNIHKLITITKRVMCLAFILWLNEIQEFSSCVNLRLKEVSILCDFMEKIQSFWVGGWDFFFGGGQQAFPI